MDPSLDNLFKSSSQLLRSTGGLGLLPQHPQESLRHEAAKFFPPRAAWPLAAYPLRSASHSSAHGMRNRGVNHSLATPQSPLPSSATPCLPLQIAGASAGGSPSPSLLDLLLRIVVLSPPSLCLWWCTLGRAAMIGMDTSPGWTRMGVVCPVVWCAAPPSPSPRFWCIVPTAVALPPSPVPISTLPSSVASLGTTVCCRS